MYVLWRLQSGLEELRAPSAVEILKYCLSWVLIQCDSKQSVPPSGFLSAHPPSGFISAHPACLPQGGTGKNLAASQSTLPFAEVSGRGSPRSLAVVPTPASTKMPNGLDRVVLIRPHPSDDKPQRTTKAVLQTTELTGRKGVNPPSLQHRRDAHPRTQFSGLVRQASGYLKSTSTITVRCALRTGAL